MHLVILHNFTLIVLYNRPNVLQLLDKERRDISVDNLRPESTVSRGKQQQCIIHRFGSAHVTCDFTGVSKNN